MGTFFARCRDGRAHRGGIDFIFPSGNRWRPNLDRSPIGTPIWASCGLGRCGSAGCAVTCAAHGQVRGRAPAPYIFARHGDQASKIRTSRAVRGWSRLCRRHARVEGGGQGVEHQTGEPRGKPLSWLAGDLAPPRAPRLARDRRAGRPDRGERANVPHGADIGPDALTTLEAEAEDRAEAQGDDELAIVSTTWA